MIYFLGWVVLVVIGLVWLKGATGGGCCRGNCEQGRKACDCEDK